VSSSVPALHAELSCRMQSELADRYFHRMHRSKLEVPGPTSTARLPAVLAHRLQVGTMEPRCRRAWGAGGKLVRAGRRTCSPSFFWGPRDTATSVFSVASFLGMLVQWLPPTDPAVSASATHLDPSLTLPVSSASPLRRVPSLPVQTRQKARRQLPTTRY